MVMQARPLIIAALAEAECARWRAGKKKKKKKKKKRKKREKEKVWHLVCTALSSAPVLCSPA
jgi:hypothetical protein